MGIATIPGMAPIGSAGGYVEIEALECRSASASTPSAGEVVAKLSARAGLIVPFRAVLEGDSSSSVLSAATTFRRTRVRINSLKSGGIALRTCASTEAGTIRPRHTLPTWGSSMARKAPPCLEARLNGADHPLYAILSAHRLGRRNPRCGRSLAGQLRWRP